MPHKQKSSVEEKAKVIVDYINNGISLSEAARRRGVAQDTVGQWVRNYEANGMAACGFIQLRSWQEEKTDNMQSEGIIIGGLLLTCGALR